MGAALGAVFIAAKAALAGADGMSSRAVYARSFAALPGFARPMTPQRLASAYVPV